MDECSDVKDGQPESDFDTGFLIFRCNDSQCVKWYRTIDRCEDHIAAGKHVYPTTKFSLLDVAVKTFKAQTEKITSIPAMTLTTHDTCTPLVNNSQRLLEGWALPPPKSNKRFSKEQIAFLVEKYDEGERSGSKWNPSAVASVRQLTCYE